VAFLLKGRKAGVYAGARRWWRDVVSLGSKQFKLKFLCSCCFGSFCGPNGDGYTVTDPSALQRAVAPVVFFGVQLILAAAGVTALAVSDGAVDLKLPGGTSLFEASAAHDVLKDILALEVVLTINAAVERIAGRGDGGGDEASAAEVAALGATLAGATGDGYAKLKALLDSKLDPPDPSTQVHAKLGLEHLVGGKGTAAMAKQWVCRACKPGFVKGGADFKPAAGGGNTAAAEGDFAPLPSSP